jgi:hypothetical protein
MPKTKENGMRQRRSEQLRAIAKTLRRRADSFRWLGNREPARRTLTKEECHVLAREAERIAGRLELNATELEAEESACLEA